jgi:hypothetical protein
MTGYSSQLTLWGIFGIVVGVILGVAGYGEGDLRGTLMSLGWFILTLGVISLALGILGNLKIA